MIKIKKLKFFCFSFSILYRTLQQRSPIKFHHGPYTGGWSKTETRGSGEHPHPPSKTWELSRRVFKFKLNFEFYIQAQSCFVGQNCIIRIFWTTHILTIPRTAHMRDLSAVVYHIHLYFCFVRLKTAAASLVHSLHSALKKRSFSILESHFQFGQCQ